MTTLFETVPAHREHSHVEDDYNRVDRGDQDGIRPEVQDEVEISASYIIPAHPVAVSAAWTILRVPVVVSCTPWSQG
jgi:hypothetical protein